MPCLVVITLVASMYHIYIWPVSEYETGQFQMSAYIPHCHFAQNFLITYFFSSNSPLGKLVLGGEQAVITGIRDIPECRNNKKGSRVKKV